ncbi:DUF1508 domain-containing protein [Pseudarthrobacter sp. NamE5]|uniref:YegP family protein n=1 Tax=Pseudarthrobacter sp. NamE5 TaxID=2576839 RepID=UPI00110AD7DF|nr:DUF1508 domain-containing protein [Pseudarthrobacter sp. NamE5]TLM87497.1 DUF1508 domain-containing protein [Pseudarthrobacter sp. NamE5]
MAGTFELFVDEDSRIRFRLMAPDGSVLAVSGQYPDKHHAAAAIKDVRECAGTGLIRDAAPAPNLVLARAPWRGSQVRPFLSRATGARGAA